MISFSNILNGASEGLAKHKKNRIVSAVILGAAGLLFGFGTDFTYENGTVDVVPSYISLWLYIVSFVCLFTACMNAFGDMHGRTEYADRTSAAERYFSKLTEIFFVWFLPFLLSAACGIAVSLASEFGRGGDGISHIFAFEASALLWTVKKILFVLAVVIICLCCTGSIAESIYLPIGIIAAAEFLPVLLYRLITDNFADISVTIPDVYSYLKYDFPFYSGSASAERNVSAALQCLLWSVVIVCGLFLYKKRKAEDAGNPIVFKVFFEISTAFFLMFFFTAASIENHLSILEILLAWFGSIVLRLIVSKKDIPLRKIVFWTVGYISYYLAFLLLMFMAFKTGGFGILYREADSSEFDAYMILSAEITAVDEENYNYGSTISERYFYTYKFIEYDYPGNAENVEKFLEYTENAEKAQCSENGVFLWKMFGSSFGSELYQCRVIIKTNQEKRGFYPTVYFRNFYFSQSDADEFIRALESLEFTETEIDDPFVSID